MKAASIFIGLAVTCNLSAQTIVDKAIPVSSGQQIILHFDYPELVRVSSWEKNEIGIHCSVSINQGENDGAFELLNSTSGNVISIRNQIKDFDNLPHRITVMDGAQRITFKDRAALKKYQQENVKGNFNTVSNGVDMEIIIDVKVPRNIVTIVESVYGMVEVKDFTGPLTVDATYGGVDATLIERNAGHITAETNYGEIFTNLDSKFGGNTIDEDFHTVVTAKPGNGPQYIFESTYGNVYIRKAGQ
ncbi:MAG: hypothetical protein WKF87_03745 [Chryseolinea sp.]